MSGSSFVFLYSLFLFLVLVCVCVSLFCFVFVCLVLLLPFVWGFVCLFGLFLIVLVAVCLFLSLLLSWGFLVYSFSFFFFLLPFSFFLSFSPPFLPGHVARRVLVPKPGVGPEPLGWQHRVQDTGMPQYSLPQGILNGESSPRGLHLNSKTQLHPAACRLQC